MPDVRHGTIATVLGELTLVAARDQDGDGLAAIYFPGHWHLPEQSTFGTAVDASADDLFQTVKAQLDEYFDGQRTQFTIPLVPQGNEFSQKVWAMLQDIPFGQTMTYGDIAERLGNKHLAQRVGQVVGRNPISIIIPCHRVIGSDGSLTGYAGGLERKRLLLELEEPAEVTEARLF